MTMHTMIAAAEEAFGEDAMTKVERTMYRLRRSTNLTGAEVRKAAGHATNFVTLFIAA